MSKELLQSIESLWIGAGEECVENYQSDLDWKKYCEYMDKCKELVEKELKNLKRYTKHIEPNCNKFYTDPDGGWREFDSDRECTCGLDELLKD